MGVFLRSNKNLVMVERTLLLHRILYTVLFSLPKNGNFCFDLISTTSSLHINYSLIIN